MAKHINLFPKTKQFASTVRSVERVVLQGTIVGVVIALGIAYGVYMIIESREKIVDLERQQTQLLRYIHQEQEFIAQLDLLSTKKKALNVFLQDDAEFLPYYDRLVMSIEEGTGTKVATYARADSTESAKIQSFLMNKTLETGFQIVFANESMMLDFLSYADSSSFTSHFAELTVSGFSLRDNKNIQDRKQPFTLSFSGTFKPMRGGNVPTQQ